MYAIYAFCRIVDDIADEDGALPDKLSRLRRLARSRRRTLPRQADGPVTRVLLARGRAVSRCASADFLAVIDGMQMDAETVIVAPDLATLDLYCDRVASAVGRLSVRAFGDCLGRGRRGRVCSGPRAATDQHSARHQGRRRTRPALLAGGVSGSGQGPASPHPGVGVAWIAGCVCSAGGGCARPFSRGAGAYGALRPESDETGSAMGATYAAILTELIRGGWRVSGGAGQSAAEAEIVVADPLRDGVRPTAGGRARVAATEASRLRACRTIARLAWRLRPGG